ncbi:nucleotide pyrophosphatase/phosphodiesterase family protein [Verrucomicrobium sp. BvORR106]|uniref:nucleotide pyrophosphatase/phosphodiesterase family protein n=1 Tax=Verrucomicrobium sp. BvORR106 TaxID=1403819 RepID=UPI000A434C4A|nr:nucleotide pyrophosphatase/phosphodiesterase family protein [Verrucomicrobium sp. BvORR106]
MSPRRVLLFLLATTALAALGIYAWGLLPKSANNRIVIVVGLDGFRSDYLLKFQPPALSKLAAEGVTTSRMIPSFPSLTFPNLYTLVTGLRPARHGIVGNSMYDPEFDAKFSLGSPAVKEGRWWGGEPVWITAERQGIRSACMFWPGSEAEIQGRRPHDWRDYDGSVSAEKRVATVLEWLGRPEAERPRLVTLYFHEADSAGHKYGPDALETAEAVKVVDQSLGQLMAGIKQLGLEDRVHLICAADHGMTEVSPDRIINLADLIDLKTTEVDSTGAVSGLRPKGETPEALVAKLTQPGARYKAYLASEVPEQWHFKDHRRIAPVILVADEGWSIVRKPVRTDEERRTFLKATHGFPPELPSMGATFIAWGPAYRRIASVPEFANTEVYSLICATLGIEPAENDGTGVLLPGVLAR